MPSQLAGARIPASRINARIGTFEGTADITAAPYSTEAVMDTITVSVVNGERYRISYYFPHSGSIAADRFLIRIRTGTTTGGAQLTYNTADIHSTSGVYAIDVIVEWVASSTGSQSFCTTAQRAGTGNLTPKGATSQLRLLTVDLVNTV